MEIGYIIKEWVPWIILHKQEKIVYEFMVPTTDKYEKVYMLYEILKYLDNRGQDTIIKQSEIDSVLEILEDNIDMYETL